MKNWIQEQGIGSWGRGTKSGVRAPRGAWTPKDVPRLEFRIPRF